MKIRMNRAAGRTRMRGALGMLAAGAACVLAIAAAGCNYVGPLGYLVGGDGTIPAAYTLDETRTVVIFVDDRENLLRNRTMRRVIAQSAEKTLQAGTKKAKAAIVSSEAVDNVTAADKWGKPMGIAQVGEAVNADMVVYATIDQFTLTLDNASLTPVATMRVKVVDTRTKKRLFPEDEKEWFTVKTAAQRREGNLPRTQSEATVEEQKLAERCGRDLANVFLDHPIVPQENKIKGYE